MMQPYYKEKVLEIIKVIAFILIFLILLESFSAAFFSNRTATKFNNKQRDAYAFVQEPPDSIQIVGIGNSNLYSGLSPLDLWKAQGYTSSVCASAGQTVQESRILLEQVFEQQSPQLVIIEADMLYNGRPKKKNDLRNPDRFSAAFDRMNPDLLAQEVESVFSIFKFHNYWKNIFGKSVPAPCNTHGYKYNSTVYQLERKAYMEATVHVEPIPEMNLEQLDLLVEFCKENHAEVLIVVMPAAGSWNGERHNAVKQYADQNQLPFVDLNLLYEKMGIGMETCFRDKGDHLNYQGAKAVTAYLGTYIQGRYTLRDLRADGTGADWDENLKRFETQLAKTQ